MLVLAGLAFGLRAPLPGVLIGLGFVAVVAVSLAAVSYAVGRLLKSEDALAPLLNMIMVPLMLLFNAVVAEGIGVSVELAAICLWLAGRAFAKENA